MIGRQHRRGLCGTWLALAALAFAGSGRGVGAAQLRRRPLDFVTPEARPKPLNDPRRISEICARLADASLSYDKRAELAKTLAGVKSRKAVDALIQGLLEPAYPLRIACARSLRWAASGGDKAATDALYHALVDAFTDHSSGQAIAKALLDARGAAEVLPTVMKQTIDRATGGDFKGRSDLAWSRVSSQLGPYHMVSCVGGRSPYAEAVGYLATAFRRSSDTRFVALLDYFEQKGFRLASVITAMNAQEVLRSIIRGISNRKPAARAALLRWLEKSTGAVTGGQLSGRLESALVRELAKLLPKLKESDRKRLLAILDRTCHGRAADVIAGKVALSDVVLAAAKKRLEILRAGRRPPGWPEPGESIERALPVGPWGQLAFEFKRGADHPYVDVLRRPDKYPRPYGLIWNCRPGVPVWEVIVQERVGELVHERLAGMQLRTGEQIRTFTTLFHLAMNLAGAAERREIVERAVRRSEEVAPEFQGAILCAASVCAFGTADVRLPLHVAEWIVELAERTSRHGLAVTQSKLAFALENLTPEPTDPDAACFEVGEHRTFDTMKEAEAHMAESAKRFLESQEKPVSAETAAAWRAWLERFRKLPVFRNARKASARH